MFVGADNWKALKGVSLAILVFGCAGFSGLISARPQHENNQVVAQLTPREPASLAVRPVATESSIVTISNLVDLGCVDQSSSDVQFESSTRYVQIRGKICGPEGQSKRRAFNDSQISNSANGFEATIFYPKSNTFTSDLITLSAGENKLMMVHELYTGSKLSREIHIRFAAAPRLAN